MNYRVLLIAMLVPILFGCGKSSRPGLTNRPADAMPADSAPTTLSASLSDDEILRALKLDPKALQAERDQGKDGHTTSYRDADNQVFITRSKVSGVIVMRLKPESQKQEWMLGVPPPSR
jgi:hypothetical protein